MPHLGHGGHHIARELRRGVDNLHRAAAKHVAGPHENRIADGVRDGQPLFDGRHACSGRAGDAERRYELVEPLTVLSLIDGGGRRAEDLKGAPVEGTDQVDRRLSAELRRRSREDILPTYLDALILQDTRDALLIQRLEIEAARGVKVR